MDFQICSRLPTFCNTFSIHFLSTFMSLALRNLSRLSTKYASLKTAILWIQGQHSLYRKFVRKFGLMVCFPTRALESIKDPLLKPLKNYVVESRQQRVVLKGSFSMQNHICRCSLPYFPFLSI